LSRVFGRDRRNFFEMAGKDQQPYQQLMVLFSSYVVALRDQDFSDEAQRRILAKTSSALTNIFTHEVLSKPRKRQGVYRAVSTPAVTSKKVPADQRVQFSPEEIKQLRTLDKQIGTKLYSAGITPEQFVISMAQKTGRVTPGSIREGLGRLKLTFNDTEMELIMRKYNAEIDEFNSDVNYTEYTHLFPPKPPNLDQEKDSETMEGSETKGSSKPKRSIAGRSITFKDQHEANVASLVRSLKTLNEQPETSTSQEMSDDDDEPNNTPIEGETETT